MSCTNTSPYSALLQYAGEETLGSIQSSIADTHLGIEKMDFYCPAQCTNQKIYVIPKEVGRGVMLLDQSGVTLFYCK